MLNRTSTFFAPLDCYFIRMFVMSVFHNLAVFLAETFSTQNQATSQTSTAVAKKIIGLPTTFVSHEHKENFA